MAPPVEVFLQVNCQVLEEDPLFFSAHIWEHCSVDVIN